MLKRAADGDVQDFRRIKRSICEICIAQRQPHERETDDFFVSSLRDFENRIFSFEFTKIIAFRPNTVAALDGFAWGDEPAASKMGVKVILAERNSFLGGKATAAVVGTICGLYYRNKSEEAIFCCSGFAKDFAQSLAELSSSTAQFNSEGLHYLPYAPFAFKSLGDILLKKAGVQVFLHTTISSCASTASTIKTIEAIAFDQQVTFVPKTIVDCSGEAIVSHIAGLSVDENEEYQAAAQVFEVHKVASEKESALSLSLLKELTKATEAGELESALLRTSIVPGSLKGGTLLLKIGLPFKISHQLNSVSQIESDSRKLVLLFFNFVKDKLLAFKNAQLGEVATEAGIRTGRRPIGKYRLSNEDVVSCRKFETGIANGAWPIEYWEPGKKVIMNYFSEKDCYQIPAESLCSATVTNLFFAGRNMSSDNQAIASARVIGTCLQTGYAAGKLAAAQVQGKDWAAAIASIRKEQII